MDAGSAARIARLAVPHADADVPAVRVLEIGAGTGQLTRALLALGAPTFAIEIDAEMVRVLRDDPQLRAAALLQADAMAFDYAAFAASGPWIAAGNLPYNVATPLIVRLVEMREGPQLLVVTIQKDVADRLAARPGTKAYGSLSVAVQYAMEVERAFSLGPGAFYPRPKVDSTVVLLRRRDRPAAAVRDEAWFRQVVRAAFAYRRKTLANSLSLALTVPRAAVAGALQSLDIDPEIRGEQLDIADLARLADALGT
ncbi:MAG: 16S rRNA (adenine(1518)-N(6)/adenine(1519)-N(6))-dimethyltransferase RsmA [Firmicutes bacterium]|nr:16S rRNA (adenine(1518)-N(6)/adenine(1519)-N(6))-dimethyltransferase RsmA [Bacillota bacterium]